MTEQQLNILDGSFKVVSNDLRMLYEQIRRMHNGIALLLVTQLALILSIFGLMKFG